MPTGLSRGSLILNGHNLGRYPDVVKCDGQLVPLYLPECWVSPDGQNTLVVFDEEGLPPAQAKLTVEVEASREVIDVTQPGDSSAPFTAPPLKPIKL